MNNRSLKRDLPALLVGLVLLSLFLLPCRSPVAPIQVYFLGNDLKMKVYRTPEGELLPRYEVSRGREGNTHFAAPAQLRLLFDPMPDVPLDPSQCSPFLFDKGNLAITLTDPGGDPALSTTLPFDALQDVKPGLLLPAIPDPALDGAPFELPFLEGRWRLELTWTCDGKSLEPVSSSHAFVTHLSRYEHPETAPFWQALGTAGESSEGLTEHLRCLLYTSDAADE